MKIILFIFLIPFFAISQRFDGDTTKATKYFIKRDTNTMGVITIQYLPTENLQMEFDSKLNSISGDSTALTNQRDEITAKLKDLILQRNQIIARKTKLGLK